MVAPCATCLVTNTRLHAGAASFSKMGLAMIMKFAGMILAGALASSVAVAQTPTKFDLICEGFSETGDVVYGPIGTPHGEHFIVDLNDGLWCHVPTAKDVCFVQKIVEVTPSRYTFKVKKMSDRYGYNLWVDRLDGKWVQTPNPVITGTCKKADFSGFPAPAL